MSHRHILSICAALILTATSIAACSKSSNEDAATSPATAGMPPAEESAAASATPSPQAAGDGTAAQSQGEGPGASGRADSNTTEPMTPTPKQ